MVILAAVHPRCAGYTFSLDRRKAIDRVLAYLQGEAAARPAADDRRRRIGRPVSLERVVNAGWPAGRQPAGAEDQVAERRRVRSSSGRAA